MSSIEDFKIKTFELSDLVGRTITLRELRDDVVSLLTAFDNSSGEVFIISGEIKEDADQELIKERKRNYREGIVRHTLQRSTRPDERTESTIERYDRTESMILEHPYRLYTGVVLKNNRVHAKDIAKQLDISPTSVSLMFLVARERGYITINEDKTYAFTEMFKELHPKAKEA